MSLGVFIGLTLLAEILGTIGGFGSSALFVPLGGFFFPFTTVLAFTGILHVFSNGAKLWLFGKHINRRVFLMLGVPSLVFSITGALTIVSSQTEWAQILLGLFLVSGSLLLLVFPSLQLKDKNSHHILAGCSAGFLAGFTGTGGPVRALALSAVGLTKEGFIATSCAIDMLVDVSRSIIYLGAGYLLHDHYWFIPVLAVIAIAGSWMGKQILEYISKPVFRKIVLLMVLAIGIVLLIKTGWYDT